jgi:formylglycine-generating enzyme required for sulfatase activity
MATSGQLILSDSGNVSVTNSPGTGFGANGVNYEINTRLGGSKASGLTYYQTATTRAASSYSIKSNKVNVATDAGAGRYTFATNGFTPFDVGAALGTSLATAADPVIYDLAVKVSNGTVGTARTSFGLATVDNGIQAWNLGIQFVNNGSNLDLYRRVDSGSNPSGTDYNNVIASLAGKAKAEVALRLRITDAGGESGAGHFNSNYEVFADGNSVFVSSPGDFRFENSAQRLVLFDTAGTAGPVTYDAFSLTLVNGAPTNTPPTQQPLLILSHGLTPNGFQFVWSSQVGTNYTVLKCTNLLSPRNWVLAGNITASGTNTSITTPIDQSVISYYCVTQLATSGLGISNVVATQRSGSGLVDIYFNLGDLYFGSASISILVSTDGGQTYRAAGASFTGDVGPGIAPGTGHIVWDAGADLSALSAGSVKIKVIADRSQIGDDMAFIPAGVFNMGDSKGEGLSCETPVHPVNLSAFYVSRLEVTKALWDEVRDWGTNHGYKFENPGVSVGSNLPIQQVSWYDAVKWCNARSEKEGLAPAYFEDRAWTTVYRVGEINLTENNVRWSGAGYRLPTEAEWEKAARGGLAGKRFPLGDTVNQAQVNYWSTAFESFDVDGTPGPHPLAPQFPNTLPVGHFLPSGYGLYDMAGNTWEWCWDLYGDAWYSDASAQNDNTHGPSSASWGGDRVYRGGSGVDIAWKSRVANRADAPPRFAMGHFGFRVVLPTGENLISTESPTFSLTP